MKGTPNPISDDKARARRVLRGDVEEFSRLVTEYAPKMVRLAAGIVGRHDAAQDVVQDALVKAYERLGSWRGESALSTWLYRIVYTTAISSLRGGRMVAGEDVAVSGATGAAWVAADDDGEWELTEENIARMRQALELLAPLDRTLVTLFYLEDRSVRDVAAICGESETNVKTRLHRARARLRKLMKQ